MMKRMFVFYVEERQTAIGEKVMTQEQEPLRIIIEEEDLPMIAEGSASRGQDIKGAAKNAAASAGQVAGGAAKKVWNSESRRKATGAVSRSAANVTAKGSKAIANKVADTVEQQTRQQMEAMQARAQEIDWKQEAQKGVATGLQWLSQQVSGLANRFTPVEPVEKDPPAN